jgi:diguanylate cyclase (GGDEF)-like protein
MPRTSLDPALASTLRGSELFSNLLDDDLAYLATRVERLRLAGGSRAFGQGDKAGFFLILESGVAAIYRRDEAGREAEAARYIAGDTIGDFEFAVGADFTGSCRCEEDCAFLRFPGSGMTLDDVAGEKPDFAARLLLRSAGMISARLRSTQALISRNSPWVRELRRQIYTDPGTGLWSRAFLDEELPRLVVQPTALILLKPDGFKELNDAHGHQAGDAAMERFAEMLAGQVERLGRGWALRLRSNEMGLVIPSCAEGEATETARILMALTGALDLSRAVPGCGFRFTASAAVALWPADGPDWKRLVEEAYSILTKAWSSGGDRIYRLRARKQGEAR